MPNIKEIALNIADKSGAVAYSPAPLRAVRGYSFTFEQLQNFAEALVAEIQRRGEPVYQVCKSDSVSLSSAWIDVDSQTYDDAGLYPEYGRRILYTFLPSIEALEDKVAEACAKVAEERMGYRADMNAIHALEDVSESIRSGAWKEFKQS